MEDTAQSTQPTEAQQSSSTSAALTPTSAAAPAQASSPPWLGEADELTIGYVQNKGWQNPKQLLESYQNLEKTLGADRAGNTIIVPKAGADPKEWDAVFNRLGRPASPEGYSSPLLEGGDAAFQGLAFSEMHKLGLTKGQGESITNWYNQTVSSAVESQRAAQQEAWSADQQALTSEWGAAYNQNVASASTAARALGITAENIDKMSSAMGHGETMRLLQKIGSGMKESDFVTGSSSQGSAMTPAQAKDEIRAFKADADKVKKYLGGDAGAKAEMERLHNYAYPS